MAIRFGIYSQWQGGKVAVDGSVCGVMLGECN
jgi:hypothetical protein